MDGGLALVVFEILFGGGRHLTWCLVSACTVKLMLLLTICVGVKLVVAVVGWLADCRTAECNENCISLSL